MTSSSSRPALWISLGMLLGGLLAALVLKGGEPAAASNEARAAETLQAITRLGDRVEDLVRQHGDLTRRLRDLELAMLAPAAAPAPLQPVAADPATGELEDLRLDVARLAGAVRSAGPEGVGGGPLVDQVVEALEVIEAQQRAEREEQWEQRQQEWIDRRIENLTERLGLDANQTVLMRETLDAGMKARRELETFDGSREERRVMRDTAREEAKTKVTAFLSPSQLQLLEDEGGLEALAGGRSDRRRRRR